MRQTMKDIMRECRARKNHFFDKDTMEFWNTRIESPLYPNNTFVTSEDNYNRSKTLYTVRLWHPNAKLRGEMITTVGKFQEHETLEDALRVALHYRENAED